MYLLTIRDVVAENPCGTLTGVQQEFLNRTMRQWGGGVEGNEGGKCYYQ